MSDTLHGFRRCPHCAEVIRVEARLCRFCGQPVAAGEGAGGQPTGSLWVSRLPRILTMGDRRIATVFFFDIGGFTRLAQRLDPEEVQEFLNDFYSEAIAVIERYDGTVDNIVGDEIMAVFGAPIAHENDPELALRAACDVLDLTRTFSSRHSGEITIHGGIHTGLVVTGEIGASTQTKFSLVGTTVNMAARLTAAAGRGTVLVSAETMEQTAGQFLVEEVPPLALRDFDAPQRAFRLLGVNPSFQSLATPPRPERVPFVGRDAELAVMREFLGSADPDGRPRTILIRGEMGLGKTRLAVEASARFACGARFVRGAGAHWARHTSLFAAVDLLRQTLGISPLDRTDSIRAKLSVALADFSKQERPDEICLRHLLGDPEAASVMTREQPLLRRQRLTQAYVDLYRGLSRRGPIVLFVDDMQWVDAATEDFINALGSALGLGPCWVILAARPDREDLRVSPSATVISLTPLSESDGALVLKHLLENSGISPEIVDLLVTRGEGNPLFLEELGRIAEEEARAPLPDGPRLADRLREGVPASVHNLIQARLDRLEMRTRLVLQCGAVLGRQFFFDTLTLIEIIRQGLLERLVTLESLEILLRRLDDRFLTYYFKHSLTQEVVYQSLLRRQRTMLHELAAGALETLFEGQRREFAAQIAFHWRQAGKPLRAAPHQLLAALRAFDLGDLAQAEAQVETLIEQLTSEESREETVALMADALRLSGTLHRLSGRPRESQRRLHAAVHTARQARDDGRLCHALRELAHTVLQQGRHGFARRVLNQALQVARRLGDDREMALCVQLLAIIDWRQGHLTRALENLREAMALTDPVAEPVIAGDSHNNLGLILWHRGDLEQAREELVAAMELRRRAHQLFGEIATASNLGIVAEQLGHFREAGETYRRALARAEALGYREAETALHANIANLALAARRWRVALDHSLRAESVAAETGDRRSLAIALENRAAAEIEIGEADEAQRSLDRAEVLARQTADLERQAGLCLVRARLEMRMGRVEAAERALQEAAQIAAESGHDHLKPSLLVHRARLEAARGRPEEARALLLDALDASRNTGQRTEELLALRFIAEAGGSLGFAPEFEAECERELAGIEREVCL